ncbi:hypothetical protein ACJX0J_024320, partial [Zea mays]
ITHRAYLNLFLLCILHDAIRLTTQYIRYILSLVFFMVYIFVTGNLDIILHELHFSSLAVGLF